MPFCLRWLAFCLRWLETPRGAATSPLLEDAPAAERGEGGDGGPKKAKPEWTPGLGWMKMNGQSVPKYAYSQETAERAEARWWTRGGPAGCSADSELRLLKYLGNVVLLGVLGSVAVWLPFVCFPWLLREAAVCDSAGLAAIERKWYLVFAPFILTGLALEFSAFRHVLPSVLRVHAPTVLGHEWGPRAYMMLQFGISAIAHADVMTNGVFLARLLKTYECDPNRHTWAALGSMVLWLLMLPQVVYVVFGILPIGKVRDDSSEDQHSNTYYPWFDFTQRGGPGSENKNVVYRTVFERLQTYQNVIFILADGARWAAIKDFERGFLSVFHADRNQGSTAFKVLKTTMARSLLVLCLETTLFLGAQCYMYYDKQGADTATGVGILLSVLTGAYAIRVQYDRIEHYTGDVGKGHQRYLALPPLKQAERRVRFPSEPNIVAKAHRIRVCHTALVSVMAVIFSCAFCFSCWRLSQ